MKANPFCSSLRLAAQALALDADLSMVWKALPPGMGAGYDRYKNQIIMPAVNTSDLTQEETRKLNAFSYHERLHHYLSEDEMELAFYYDNPEIEKKLKKWIKNKCKDKPPEGMKRGMCCELTNFIEDCRIELNDHCRLDGDLEDLIWYRCVIAGPEMEKDYDTIMQQNPWGIIMQTMQYNLCEYKAFSIDEEKYPEQAKMYEIAWNIITDGRFEKSRTQTRKGARVSYELAREIIEAWKTATGRDVQSERNNPGEMCSQPGPNGKPQNSDKDAHDRQDGDNDLFENEKETHNEKEDGQPEDGNSDGETDEKGKEDSDSQGGKGEESGEGEGDKEESKGESKGKGSESDGDSDKDTEPNSDGESEGSGKPSEDKGKSGDSKGQGSESDDAEKGEKQSGPVYNEEGKRDIGAEFERDQTKYDGRYNINPDKLNQEAGDMARDESGNTDGGGKAGSGLGSMSNEEQEAPEEIGGTCNPYMDKTMKTPYVPYDVLDRICYPKLFPENYRMVKESIEHKLNATRKHLARLLIGESQTRTRKYLKKGKLDRRRLCAVVQGDDRVFKNISPGIKNEVAVQLIIDLSGSMSGDKARLAVQVACLFAEILNALSVPFEVLGYNSSGMPSKHKSTADKQGFARTYDIVNHWVFKEFNESWSAVHARLGACTNGMRTYFGDAYIDTDKIPVGKKVVRDLDGCVGGCNCDHETVLLGAGRLWVQPQERKIQIILADGLPSGYYGDYGGQLQEMLINVNNRIVAAGIEQVAFGIMCKSVCNYYSKSVYIKNLDELGPKALEYLSSSLRNTKMRTPDRFST